jgi:phospholipid-binding lipoprotein MlaA
MARLSVIRLLGVLMLLVVAIGPAAAEPANGLDGFNEWAYAFNSDLATAVVKPVLSGVRELPEPLPEALTNAFSNLTEPVSALSHLMAGDTLAAAQSTARFAVNSTVGLLGLLDAATAIGLPPRKKHFSEGVCALGLPLPDRIVILPVAGPSSIGIAAVALIVMAGSTWGLALISVDLAVASVLADAVGAAAALENAAASDDGGRGRQADEAAFRSYLSAVGC